MNENQLRKLLSRVVHVEPQLSYLIEGPIRDNDSSLEISWFSYGRCISIDDPRMNICCRQSPCITTKAELKNLCFQHDEIANIMNWSHQFNQAPSFAPSTFRNQA